MIKREWVLWEVASARLKEAGYKVERGTYCLYARHPDSIIDPAHRVPITQGRCSNFTVNKLCRALQAEKS